MASTSMVSTPAPTHSGFVPDQDDLDEMHRVRAVHDLIDLAPGLPQELKWGLLDYVAAVLEGSRRATSAADRAA